MARVACELRSFGDATGRRARYDLRRWLVANEPSKLTTNTTKTAAVRMTTITGLTLQRPFYWQAWGQSPAPYFQ